MRWIKWLTLLRLHFLEVLLIQIKLLNGQTVFFDNIDLRTDRQYINPDCIASLYLGEHCNSNSDMVSFTVIVLTSTEVILTTMTVDEILELIKGKPKK